MSEKYQIDFFAEPTPWDWLPTDLETFLPATQSWLIELAQALSKRGHGVTVFWDSKHKVDYKGVHYRTKASYDGKSEIAIGWNHPDAFPEELMALKTIYWTNGPEIWPHMGREERYAYEDIDQIVSFCKWHTEELQCNIGHVADKIIPIGPGLDPKEFPSQESPKKRRQFLYASSWDRGLTQLLRFWPRIYREFPDAKLLVTYGQDFSSKVVGRKLEPPPNIDQPGVHVLGQISRKEMGKVYAESDYLLYPCTGGERFCQTTWKAQYCRTYPVFYPTMALAETVKVGFAVNSTSFVDTVISLCQDRGRLRGIKDVIRDEMIFPSWDDVAGYWETIFEDEVVSV